jgi:H3 lysine-79-specific histone-lysine N-methyltransferase
LGLFLRFVDETYQRLDVVLQTILRTGCTSYGIELMLAPPNVARERLEQLKIRYGMWGLPIGEVELEQGDTLQSARADELIPRAGVVW